MKKLILAFTIVIGGMFVACNNHSTTNSENDSVVVEEVIDSICADSCACDTVCVDTCICDSVQ